MKKPIPPNHNAPETIEQEAKDCCQMLCEDVLIPAYKEAVKAALEYGRGSDDDGIFDIEYDAEGRRHVHLPSSLRRYQKESIRLKIVDLKGCDKRQRNEVAKKHRETMCGMIWDDHLCGEPHAGSIHHPNGAIIGPLCLVHLITTANDMGFDLARDEASGDYMPVLTPLRRRLPSSKRKPNSRRN